VHDMDCQVSAVKMGAADGDTCRTSASAYSGSTTGVMVL